MRSIVSEHTRTWNRDEYWIGCSGNFTIERFLHHTGARLHSNDVSIYSCILGWYMAGKPVELSVRDEFRDELHWLEPYMRTDADRAATMMLGTRFLDYVGKPGAYYRRMLEGTIDQYADMHAATKGKLEALPFQVSSFSAMDIREYLSDVVPKDGAVISFPPFDVGGYEKMWKALETHFEWPEPDYPLLDDEGIKETLALIMDRRHWIFASNHRHPEWEENLCGVVQTSPARRPNYVYASEKQTRIVRPRERFKAIPNPRIRKGYELTGELKIAKLEPKQFYGLRSQYLNANIKMVSPPGVYAFAVLDGKTLIGAFAYLESKYAVDENYLVSDFPISGSDYPRLSKLVVMAALSEETQFVLQSAQSRRLNAMATTAFAKNPVSMKYRGLLDLDKRTESKDPHFNYELQYVSKMGRWTLPEAFADWSKRWGKKKDDA